MKLFIDGDAFPNQLKPIVYRAVIKHQVETIVVANKTVDIGKSQYIKYILAASGPDEADDKIVEMLCADDLVITADIPLADRVISKGAHAINPRGRFYSHANIKESLAMRNLMQEMRDSGMPTRGPAPFSTKDCHNFANSFNNFLVKALKK